MVLLAQHLARHRLREPQLLEAIAHFLVAQEAQLNSKVGCLPLRAPELSSGTWLGPARSPGTAFQLAVFFPPGLLSCSLVVQLPKRSEAPA